MAPGSRSTPLALALFDASQRGELRLHVRVDERSAAFLALGLAKASGRPVAVLCTSGTAAAHFHAAVIEADEAGVPLLVLTADRPPELRGTGANQAIDQLKLYGDAVRWFCEVGVPEARPGLAGYWRSLAAGPGRPGQRRGGQHARPGAPEPAVARAAGARRPTRQRGAAVTARLPESLAGRPGGAPWTRFAGAAAPAALDLPWTERGVIVSGDGADPGPLPSWPGRRAGRCWPSPRPGPGRAPPR